MKIILVESKREMLFKSEFKNLFNNLTPTRNSQTENIIYVYFDDVYDDKVKGLVYRPSNRELRINPEYFMTLRPFVSSEEEMMEMIEICYEDLTGKTVLYSEIMNNY
jgi:hypothetical protein